MSRLSAFVGHSFADQDADVVLKFLKFFDTVTSLGIGFTWVHAEEAEPKLLSQKVKEKIEDKNLFIGICTSRENVIAQQGLNKIPLIGDKYYVSKEKIERKTSDWILQEIGCAFGRDMYIIILKEEGIRAPGGIQGDLEYIPFTRDAPEQSFNQILEMIKTLLPIDEVEAIPQAEKPPLKEDEVVDDSDFDEELLEIGEDWNQNDFDRALIMAIIEEDEEREEKVSDEYLKSEISSHEYEQVAWDSQRMFFHTYLQKKDFLQNLKELSTVHPEHDRIHFYLGRLYEEYDQYESAAQYFLKSAQLANTEEGRLERLLNASRAFSRFGEYSEGMSVLEDAKGLLDSLPSKDFDLLDAMADISEQADETDFYLAISEVMLAIRPNDHSRRYSLAYKYLDLDENDLSMYHYKILSKNNPDDGVWNNIGVAYQSLDLPAKSVHAYKSSTDAGGTLSMSNLANKLIRAGFLAEAEELCEEATKKQDFDKQIGTAIAKIKDIREKESNKEEQIINSLMPRQEFYLRFGRSCLNDHLPETSGVLHGPEADISFKIEGNRFDAIGRFQKEEKRSTFSIPNLSKTTEGGNNLINYTTRYEGKIVGQSIYYSQWIHKEQSKPSEDPDIEGMMIANSDLSNIEVYEKGTRDKERFYRLEIDE